MDQYTSMKYDASKKSTTTAYLLALFLGGFGAHCFYIGKTGRGVTELILCILGFALAFVGVGIILLIIYLGMWIYDLCTLSNAIKKHNLELIEGFSKRGDMLAGNI